MRDLSEAVCLVLPPVSYKVFAWNSSDNGQGIHDVGVVTLKGLVESDKANEKAKLL